jgi:hypothetical protein
MQEILKYLIVDDVEIDSLAVEALASGYSFLKRVAICQHALEAIELIPILNRMSFLQILKCRAPADSNSYAIWQEP